MAQSKGLVLVTGINGYIASTAAKTFLDAGYNVRGTARNKASSLELLHEVFAQQIESGRLDIVEVKDITVPGAFDEAVKGVSVIAHLAAPVSFSFTEAAPIIHAAVQGTLTVFESALKFASSTMKTAIIMSSVAAITDRSKEAPYKYTEQNWNELAVSTVKEQGDAAGGPNIYQASKTLSEKAFWEFRDKHKPSWAFVAVNPGFVSGPPLNLPKDPSKLHETVIGIWHGLSGEVPQPLGGSGSLIDVRDIGRMLVFAAEQPSKADGHRLIGVSGPSTPQKILDVLNKHYPQRNGIIPVGEPGEGYLPDDKFLPGASYFDNSLVPKLTGQGWITVEQTIVDSAKAFERYL